MATDRLTLARAFEDAATKGDLAVAVRDLKIWVGSIMFIGIGLLLTGVGIATTIILNRLASLPHS